MGLGHGHAARDPEGLGDTLHRGKDLGLASRREVAIRDGDAEPAGSLPESREAGLHGALRAHGIAGVRSLHHVVGDGQIAHGGRERTHVVEADAEEGGAGPGQSPVGGLEPEDAAEGGGHADGAIRVRAQGEGNEPGPHRGARASRRPARHSGGIVGIVSRAVVRVLGGEAEGVLVHVQRAHENGARPAQPGDHGRIRDRPRALGIDPGSRQGRQARDVEEILDGEGNSRERAHRLARSHVGVHGLGLAHGALGDDGREAVELGVASPYALEGGGHELPRRHAAAADLGGHAEGVEAAHGSNTGAVSASPTGKSRMRAPAANSMARLRATPSRHSGGIVRPRRGATSST